MNYILEGRKSGKSTRLIAWLREAPAGEARVMVTATRQQSKIMWNIAKDAPDNKLIEAQFSAVGSFQHSVVARSFPFGAKIVTCVDEVESVLRQMLGGTNVALGTDTPDGMTRKHTRFCQADIQGDDRVCNCHVRGLPPARS